MASLPTGTVTFLFTDMERSTALLQPLDDRFVEILPEHYRLLRTAMQDAYCYEMNSRGDALFPEEPAW